MADTSGISKSKVVLPSTGGVTLPKVTPKTEAKTDAPGDAFATEGPKKLAEVPASKGAIQAGDAKLGKSAALVQMLLTADKASFLDTKAKLPAEKGALADRDFAKHVGLLLQTTPYGAPMPLILKTLAADPVIAARYPKLKYEDLQALHARFPAIVPPPHNPVDMGASFSPTLDGIIDIYTSNFMKSGSRNAVLGDMIGGTHAYLDLRYSPSGTQGLGMHDQLPALHFVVDKVNKLQLSRNEMFLRRVISNAPPTWSAADIADAHNKFLDYYGALMWAGDKDSIDKAKERARLTPEQVVEIMNRAPTSTGASEHLERQKQLRAAVMDALKTASPSDNLYEVLSRVVDQQAELAKPKPHVYAGRTYTHGVFEVPPGPAATLTPEALVKFVSGDPGLAEELDRLIENRKGTLDKALVNAIVKKFGPRLPQSSVSEIVRTMQAIDPVYNEALVQHLISAFPKAFGGARIETGRVEVNFLLAQQIGDAMEKMFPGATLEDVAKFMNSKGPEFTSMYPDFTGADVKLLQEAYPFLPRWDTKPDSSLLSAGDRMPLESLVKFAASTLGRAEAKELQKAIFAELAKPGASEKVPPALVEHIQRTFSRGVMNIIAEAAGCGGEVMSGANNKGSMVERQQAFQQRDLLARFIDAQPNTSLDHGQIVGILTNPNLLGMPEPRASAIATALLQARAGDLDGLHETASTLFTGDPKQETILLKLTSQFLGREALMSKIESNVFQNKELKASFQRFARIPMRLPMIQHVVEKYKAQQPLKDTNVLMVQHMLGQAYPQISGYKQLGMDPKECIFVGIPYHKNEEVEQAVAKSFGVDVRVPPRDMDELYKAIERGVDDVVAQHKKNGKPVLVVCDGPHARDYFKKKYPELAGVVRFTEQTAFGDRPEYQSDKSMSVVSYARSELKQKKEAKFIGQAVARAVNAVLTQLGTGYEEKPVLILGYGAIGQATAEAFGGDRAKIYVYDPYISPEKEAEAASLGYTVVKDKSQIAAGKFMMIGCSGHLSIAEEQILSSEPNAIYVSASSKLVEIDMRKLKELATDEQGRVRKILAAEVNDQQTWHYWLKDGTIRTVVADGLPANFNDINSVPPEFIDMTMSLSLAAAVQARSKSELGFVSLNAGDADELVKLYETMVDRMHAEAREKAAAEKA